MSFELVTAPGNNDAVHATGSTRRGTKFRKKEIKKYVLDFETLWKERFEILIDENTTLGRLIEEICMLYDSSKEHINKFIVYQNKHLTDWFRREGESVVRKNDDVPIIEILNSIRSVDETKKIVDGIDKIPIDFTFLSALVENNEAHAKYAACLPIATIETYKEKLTDLKGKTTEEERRKYALLIIKKLREGYQKTCELKGEKIDCPVLLDGIQSFPFPYPQTEDEKKDVQYGLCVGFYDFEALVSSMLSRQIDPSQMQDFTWPHNGQRMKMEESSFIIQLAHYYYTEHKIDREWYRVLFSPFSDTNLICMVPSSWVSSPVNIEHLKDMINGNFNPKYYGVDDLDAIFREPRIKIAYRDDSESGLLVWKESDFRLFQEDEDNKSFDIYFRMFMYSYVDNTETEKIPQLRPRGAPR